MAVSSESVTHPTTDILCGTVEERLALVERVARSAAFSKSVRLKDFLRYVGQRAARADVAEIHEQEIGEKVFGRRRDYDRSQDNIVRVNASELRRRIDTYFATEGADEPIVFSIPRGSYMPIFRLHSVVLEPAKPELDPTGPVSEPLAERPDGDKTLWAAWPIWALGAMLLLVGIACGFLLWQNAGLRKEFSAPAKQPTVDAFWANITKNQSNTDIVLPDDSIMVEEEMTGKRIPLRDYADRDFLHHLDLGALGPDRAGDLRIVLNHNLVTLGGFYAALRIHDMQPRSTSMHIASARFYSADSMKEDNVVLIGGAKANPWVDLYEDQLNFHFDYSSPDHSLTIQNRHPQSREASSFRDDASYGYSSVAYLPNPSNRGAVILLMGSDSDGSNAAAEYITSEESLSNLLQTLHRKSFPHFELLLRVSRLRGTPLAVKIVAYRIYN
jgi:hypothetical protein